MGWFIKWSFFFVCTCLHVQHLAEFSWVELYIDTVRAIKYLVAVWILCCAPLSAIKYPLVVWMCSISSAQKMASCDRIGYLTERETVKRLKHMGRKLPKYLASSVDKLLELLDVNVPSCLSSFFFYHSAGFECHQLTIAMFWIDLPVISCVFHIYW